jgi:glycosyltransferase involved in cell wall biosynthesis
MKKIFILVPSPSPAGPVKGAIALANELAHKRDVSIVTLKNGPGYDAELDPRVKHISLATDKGNVFFQWIKGYRKILKNAGGRSQVASISMCFSADMVNAFCRRNAVVCSSVRGNLLKNYRMDYGFIGLPLAMGHLVALRLFDHVVAMSTAMAGQVGFYLNKKPAVIGNFIDEAALERYRKPLNPDDQVRFVFLGSLTTRKQPLLIIDALNDLRKSGYDVMLDVIGSGPLMEEMKTKVNQSGIHDRVIFHGQLADPFVLLSGADALVLPSLSEGISRAALEALFLGVPCVLREVDGNSEIIKSRSEERRVGKECRRLCRSRWSPYH